MAAGSHKLRETMLKSILDFVDDPTVFALISHVLTAKKNNADEWMVLLVMRANEMFLKSGRSTRLRYKNCEIKIIK